MNVTDAISQKLLKFWHALSNTRPIFWILLYICYVPLFAFFYWLLPPGQFRIPETGGANFSDWLYYSIVTVTTLGFGDYTPCGVRAQWITAIEVLCGLVTIGFFLNAVGAMRSAIDIETELEKQRLVHKAQETEKLQKNIPMIYFKLNQFLSYCYAVTTPLSQRSKQLDYNENFTAEDLVDMNKPSGLPDDHSSRPAIESLMKCADSLSLFLDNLQGRIDLTLWPELLEDCFAFVANYQMMSVDQKVGVETNELMQYIRTNAALARNIEILLTKLAS